ASTSHGNGVLGAGTQAGPRSATRETSAAAPRVPCAPGRPSGGSGRASGSRTSTTPGQRGHEEHSEEARGERPALRAVEAAAHHLEVVGEAIAVGVEVAHVAD